MNAAGVGRQAAPNQQVEVTAVNGVEVNPKGFSAKQPLGVSR